MEKQSTEIEIAEIRDTKRSKKISMVFLFTGLVSLFYSIFSLVNLSIYINILTIFIIVSTLFLSFLPFFLTRQYYKYKNNHHKKQITLGIVGTIIIQLVILLFISLATSVRIFHSIDYSSGYPDMPCIPNQEAGVLCD